MINSNKGKIDLQGDMAEISAECVLIMKEIYKKNRELYGKEVATGILTNMLVKAIVDSVG